jgi:large subunit ribosomal protein L30
MAKLRVTWAKSEIGYVRKQRRTLRALGFHRLHQTVEHDDTPAIRGMLAKVNHLIRTEAIDESK